MTDTMSSKRGSVVDVALRRQMVKVRFQDFLNLPMCRGMSVLSPEFYCLGRLCHVKLFPGGAATSSPGQISIFFCTATEEASTNGVRYSLCVRAPHAKHEHSGEIHPERQRGLGRPINFNPNRESTPPFRQTCGVADFAELSSITDCLDDGALVIEVTFWASSLPLFVPKNLFQGNMLKLFMDEVTSDVLFKVGGKQQGMGDRKRAKKHSTNFHAHRLVLKQCAPQLLDMCGSMYEVPINNVTPEIFRHVLYYIYGGTLQEYDVKGNPAKDILAAADRFGIVNLKLEAEAGYVRSTTITVDNMMEEYMYAESMNCALLKEAVMDFVAKNRGDVIETVLLDDETYSRGLVADLMGAVTGDSPRVSELRARLEERGLDIDGSKEAMIVALRENVIVEIE